jgi:hypothetical protein
MLVNHAGGFLLFGLHSWLMAQAARGKHDVLQKGQSALFANAPASNVSTSQGISQNELLGWIRWQGTAYVSVADHFLLTMMRQEILKGPTTEH